MARLVSTGSDKGRSRVPNRLLSTKTLTIGLGGQGGWEDHVYGRLTGHHGTLTWRGNERRRGLGRA